MAEKNVMYVTPKETVVLLHADNDNYVSELDLTLTLNGDEDVMLLITRGKIGELARDSKVWGTAP